MLQEGHTIKSLHDIHLCTLEELLVRPSVSSDFLILPVISLMWGPKALKWIQTSPKSHPPTPPQTTHMRRSTLYRICVLVPNQPNVHVVCAGTQPTQCLQIMCACTQHTIELELPAVPA